MQTIKDRTNKIIRAEALLLRSESSDSDYTDMKKLLKVHTDFLSGNGLLLHERIRREVDYYEEIQELKWGLKDKVCSKLNHLASSKDKFFQNFLSLYHDEVGGHKDSLIFLLLKTYVAKVKGHNNPTYGAKILNFFLALSVTSPKVSDFVSANVCAMSGRHLQRLPAERRETPYIFRSREEQIALITESINMIRVKSKNPSMRI